MDGLPDRELVARARAGDQEAFGRLAERCQASAERIAQRMVSDPEVARELVQDSLLEAYLSLDKLREAERFRSWLYGIVLNLCRSYLRERSRRSGLLEISREDPAFDLLRLQSTAPDPQTVAEARELHHLVLSAIEDLPAGQREAALLFYFEYLSVQEIAELSGVSASAIKVRLHRARGQLREQLLAQMPERGPYRPAETRRKKMIRVEIADVIRQGERTIVFLADEAGKRVLPIWIGPFEGTSIVMGVRGFSTPRPMTYNFIANMLQALGARLEEVRVEALQDETFYGVAKLRSGEKSLEVDARPSDVLALAARTSSPINVAEQVMERAGRAVREGIQMPDDLQVESELPLPTGEGMEAILREVEERLRWPPEPGEQAGEKTG